MVCLLYRDALVLIGLLVLMVLGSQGAIRILPISKAVLIGASNVTMSCSSDRGIRAIFWNHMRVGDPSIVPISIGLFVEEPQKKLYAVEQVGSQQIDLIILSATMAVIGTYFCHDGLESKAYAQLMIIYSELVCSMTPAAPVSLVFYKEVQMSCSFSYFADTAYVSGDLIWSKGSPATIIASVTETTTSANDNLATSASTITQTPGMVNRFPIHRCTATFKFTDKMSDASSKAVDYSKSIQLFDSPIVVKAHEESLSDVDPSKVDGKGQSKSDNTGLIVGIVVAIVCVLLIAAAAIYYYLKKKKKTNQAGSGGSAGTKNKPPDDVAVQSSNKNPSQLGQQDLSQQQDLSKEGQQTTNNANNSSRNNSVYGANGQDDRLDIDEDELNYAQLQLEDYPHSLQAIQLVEETTYSDVRLA